MSCGLALRKTPTSKCPATQWHDRGMTRGRPMGLAAADVAHHLAHLVSPRGATSPHQSGERCRQGHNHFTFKAVTQGSIVTGLDPTALDVTGNYWANGKMKICFALLQVFSDLNIWIKPSRSMSPSSYPNALINFCIYSQYYSISSSCPGSVIHGRGHN